MNYSNFINKIEKATPQQRSANAIPAFQSLNPLKSIWPPVSSLFSRANWLNPLFSRSAFKFFQKAKLFQTGKAAGTKTFGAARNMPRKPFGMNELQRRGFLKIK